jgi:hypothetical protein
LELLLRHRFLDYRKKSGAVALPGDIKAEMAADAKRTAQVPEQTFVIFDPVKRRIRKYDIELLNEIEIIDIQSAEMQIVPFLGQRCR